ncbi:MAG: glycoside hydrolase family 9 protein [Bacteroidales bacterium]
MKLIKFFASFLVILLTTNTFAQLSDNEYIEAGWMTTRMYGGNRSGDNDNWLIMTHGREYDFVKDADGSHDLTGGWHDCGDHVKFGQTQFYSGYVLLLGYSAFPEGYDDFYSANYTGYKSSGDFSYGNGSPNGIPDILDEVKYATDYYIKCTPNGSTFYSQVGHGNYDHKNWVTSVTMATYSNTEGGEADGPRVINKNPDDASMASFAGAALALMSRTYRHFDESYADLCLEHAIYAYEYASAHKTNSGGGTITGSFYGPDNKWQDNYVCLLAELYWATGEESYKTEALSYSSDIINHNWVLDYENSDDLAAYALAKLGDTDSELVLDSLCDNYTSTLNDEGVMTIGAAANWGVLRYTANATFVLALQHALHNDTNISSALQGSVDYMLGQNSANQSFVVGFGAKSPQQPHHRNVFMNDNQNYTIPNKNQQHGYLVGGTYNPGSFPDDLNDYETSEGGIDYNSGLVGAIGYINSILSPVDQSKFGFQDCESPDLGDNKSLCGAGTITLDSQLPTTNRTFSWDRDGTSLSETGPTLDVSTGGTYTITADSAGCVTSDEIIITDEIPTVDLGDDKVITDPITLNTQVSGDALTYSWTKNGNSLPDNTQSIQVSEPGTYAVTVSGTGCTSKSDEIILSAPPALIQTNSPIVIDGTKDDVYPNGTAIETLLAGNPSESNLSAEWSGMWDDDNVYVFISITDDALYNDSGETWYEDDGVELFIDGDNSKATSYDNNDFQWGFIWGESLYAGGNNSANSTTGIEYTINETTNGYDVEISIPWTTIGVSPVIGNFIGFDIAINDDDDGAGRENKIAWNMTSDDGWENPSVLGELELVEATEELTTQTISLTTGWNLISCNVLPADNAISTIFSNADISIIKNSDGFWMPSQAEQLNSIQNITIGEGYLIYANSNTSVSLEGTTDETLSKNIAQGWNLVGVPTTDTRTIETQINGTDIQTVKNFDGFYDVSETANSISEFIPNKGYYIYANQSTIINW